jgi:hypothetical protein
VAGPVVGITPPTITLPTFPTVAPPTRGSATTIAAVRTTGVGDSVMEGAQNELKALGYTVDAQQNRTFEQGLDLLASLANAGGLGDRLIVHLGVNGGVTAAQLDRLATIVAGVKRVCVVTLRGGTFETSGNNVLRDGATKYRFGLLDWESYVAENPNVVGVDGIHLRPPEGPSRYAVLMSSC